MGDRPNFTTMFAELLSQRQLTLADVTATTGVHCHSWLRHGKLPRARTLASLCVAYELDPTTWADAADLDPMLVDALCRDTPQQHWPGHVRLTWARHRADYSGRAAARDCTVASGTLSRHEAGTSRPGLEQLARYAHVYDDDWAELAVAFGYSDDEIVAADPDVADSELVWPQQVWRSVHQHGGRVGAADALGVCSTTVAAALEGSPARRRLWRALVEVGYDPDTIPQGSDDLSDVTDDGSLGAHVRAGRVAARLSQAEAAARCGVGIQWFIRVEQNQVDRPQAGILRQVVDTLGLDVGEIERRTGRTLHGRETFTRPKYDRVRLGQVLAGLRTARGLARAQVADAVGIPPQTLSTYEAGARGMSRARLARFADVLDSHPTTMLCETGLGLQSAQAVLADMH